MTLHLVRILFLSIFILIGNTARSQSPIWVWGKTAEGVSNDDASSITSDVPGNIYVTGYFSSNNFILGNDTLTNSGGSDMYLLKYDIFGNYDWAIPFGGSGDEYGNSITCDLFGNVYVTGTFTSAQLIFGNDTLFNSTSLPQMFIAKLDQNGNVLWSRREGGNDWNIATGVATDPANGDVYVSGAFYNSSMIIGTDTLLNNGLYDMVLMKFDPAGNYLWAKSSGGNFNDLGNSVATDNSGNVFVSGGFASDSITFDTTTLVNAFGSIPDIFVVKYDASGNSIWSRRAGDVDNDHSVSVITDASGNVFVAGHYHSLSFSFGSSTLTNAGMGDIFLLKYDANGNAQWGKSGGGTDHDFGYSVAVDQAGNSYITGMFMSMTMTMDLYSVTNASMDEDIFIGSFDPSGMPRWLLAEGETGRDYLNCIVTLPSGSLLVAGSFSSDFINLQTIPTIYNSDSSATTSDIFAGQIDFGLIIPDQGSNSGISVYPNPANSTLTVATNSTGPWTIEIYNALGEIVSTINVVTGNSQTVNLSSEPNGIYLVKVIAEDQASTCKVIKQ